MSIAIVHACLRDGTGGSPTAVLHEAGQSDAERRAIPARMGTSHAVFVSVPDRARVSVRFFTAHGELPACGHGTVAALAFLAERTDGREERELALHTSTGVITGTTERVDGRLVATFAPGPVELREPAAEETDAVLRSVGVATAAGACVATLGRPRLLVPVPTAAALAALAPDFDGLRAACNRLGLLGCYLYTRPDGGGRLAARMFAPSIGVPEDIANANSTACLAAHLARAGRYDIRVDMGDALGAPATIVAAARPTGNGLRVRVGGAARIVRVVDR